MLKQHYLTGGRLIWNNGVGGPGSYIYDAEGVVICPDVKARGYFRTIWTVADYGYNYYLEIDLDNPGSTTNFRKLAKVPKPAETALFMENAYAQRHWWVDSYYMTIGDITWWDGAYYFGRHFDYPFINTVFVDGHVEACNKEKFSTVFHP
ncbi:MAG: hypothetical protein ACP5JO_07380 [Candidatus Ratteibacteria bacterium]